MASAPKFKIYDSGGTYQGAAKEAGAAAALAMYYGKSAQVRLGHGNADQLWVVPRTVPLAEDFFATWNAGTQLIKDTGGPRA